jgi:hypothetical protein
MKTKTAQVIKPPGVLDNFAGIIYKENDQPPTASDFGCDTLLESSKFQDNWFWMSCT